MDRGTQSKTLLKRRLRDVIMFHMRLSVSGRQNVRNFFTAKPVLKGYLNDE